MFGRKIWLLLSFILVFGKSQAQGITLGIPTNNQTDVAKPVMLTWSISGSITSAHYFKVEVVEIYDGQSITDAIANNVRVFSADFNYSLSCLIPYNLLDNCQEYAWRVTLLEIIPAGSSEPPPPPTHNGVSVAGPYSFTTDGCGSTEPAYNADQITYFELPKEPTSHIFLCKENKLSFKFESPYVYTQEARLDCRILNKTRNSIHRILISSIVKGLNYYTWDLSELNLDADEVYIFEVTDARGQTSSLNFSVQEE